MWLFFALASAVFMGVNDVLKKISLTGNAVIPVVFVNTIICSLLLLPILIVSSIFPEKINHSYFFVPSIDPHIHFLILLKSTLVLAGWLLIDFGIKHLPLTLISPIKASQPILVIIGAMIVFSERLNIIQWIGVILSVISFSLISKSVKKEGIYLKNNKWMLFVILGIFINMVCALFDKYLLSNFNQMSVFVWYNIYLTLVMSFVFIIYHFRKGGQDKFIWKWQILLVSLFICLSDFSYFYSLIYSESMISIVSTIRRCGIIISFSLGAYIFKEKNLGEKTIGFVLMLASVILLMIGSI